MAIRVYDGDLDAAIGKLERQREGIGKELRRHDAFERNGRPNRKSYRSRYGRIRRGRGRT